MQSRATNAKFYFCVATLPVQLNSATRIIFPKIRSFSLEKKVKKKSFFQFRWKSEKTHVTKNFCLRLRTKSMENGENVKTACDINRLAFLLINFSYGLLG